MEDVITVVVGLCAFAAVLLLAACWDDGKTTTTGR